MYQGFIYGITCKVTNKMYIGQTTTTVEKRLSRHFRLAFTKCSNFSIHQAMRKYGIENFQIEELERVCAKTAEDLVSDLNTLEKFYIAYYNTRHEGYNMTDGGEGFTGYIHSENEKKKFLNKMNVLWNNDKYRRRLSKSATRRFSNPKERKAQSERITKFCALHPELLNRLQEGVKRYFQNVDNRKAQSERCKQQWKTQRETFEKGLQKAHEAAVKARKRAVIQMDLKGNELREFPSVKEAIQFIGGSPNITACCKGKPKHETAGGYKWKYKN